MAAIPGSFPEKEATPVLGHLSETSRLRFGLIGRCIILNDTLNTLNTVFEKQNSSQNTPRCPLLMKGLTVKAGLLSLEIVRDSLMVVRSTLVNRVKTGSLAQIEEILQMIRPFSMFLDVWKRDVDAFLDRIKAQQMLVVEDPD